MGFFLETLFGGLMAGMLYSLIALGFVLIYKASGVFNFAQGAMVLFSALAMARFADWIPLWTGLQGKLLVNLLAFVLAMGVMIIVAWLIEKLALGRLVNLEGITLLVAALRIAYVLDGVGQTLFGYLISKIDVGTAAAAAIIGGLLIGVGEKLSEIYLGPYMGGGIEIWFAYVMALAFLLVRPQGLFGERIIDRV